MDFQYDKITIKDKLRRLFWNIIWSILFRTSPTPFHSWRIFLLRLFKAKIGRKCFIYPSVEIWAPWNLTMDDYSCLGDKVICYNVSQIKIGKFSTISQYSYLCTATHDIYDKSLKNNHLMKTISAPIKIGMNVWICADVFIGPGVNVGKGSVVYARSTVIKNVKKNSVYAGSPAKFIKERNL